MSVGQVQFTTFYREAGGGCMANDPAHWVADSGAPLYCRATGATEELAVRNLGVAVKERQLVLAEEAKQLHPLNAMAIRCHEANKTWWHDPATGEPIQRNKGELLMLIVSEVAEAMEGVRKNLNDDKLPHRKMEEVELADVLVRIFDYAGGFGLDLGAAFEEKMAYNAQRADHKPEHRLGEGGKKW